MAVDFDGVSDYLDCGSGASIDDIWDGGGAVAFRLRLDSDPGDGTSFGLVDQSNNTPSTGYAIMIANDPGATTQDRSLRLRVCWASSDGDWYLPETDTPPNGTWWHVVINYNADAAANDPVMYVDGVSKAVTESVAPTGAARSSGAASNVEIGRFLVAAASQTVDGQMEDVRLFNRILTPQEALILASGYRGPLGGEVLWLPMDGARAIAHFDGAALVAATNYLNDMSGNGNHGNPSGSPLGYASDCPRLGGITD